MRAQRATVQFQVGDIIHPQPAQVLCELFQDQWLQGEVIAITDNGRDPTCFLVVRVPNLSEPVIVPVRSAHSPPKRSVPAGTGLEGVEKNGAAFDISPK
jgi:hypothetical protein